MEVLELDGKRYVKASKAAREAGYTADYIGQLCRSGAIDAHLVGRSWYVDVSQLSEHRIEKKRSSRIKAREQVRKEIEARTRVSAVSEEKHFTNHIKTTYEPDDGELLPAVRKVVIASESKPIPKKAASQPKEVSNIYEVENAGKNIVMSGKLDIVDVSEELPDGPSAGDTVLLTPRIIKTKKKDKAKEFPVQTSLKKLDIEQISEKEVTDAASEIEAGSEAQSVREESPRIKLTFAEKIAEKTDEKVVADAQSDQQTIIDYTRAHESKDSSVRSSGLLRTFAYVCIIILCLIAVASPFLESRQNYALEEGQKTGSVIERYEIDHTEVISYISSKIRISR